MTVPTPSGAAPSADADRRRPDLRLVALALATWLSTLALLRTTAPVAVATAAAAAVVAAVLWRRVGRAGAWAGITVAALLGVVCGAAGTAPRLAARDDPVLVEALQQRAEVDAELVVRQDPRRLADPGRPPTFLVPAWLERVDDHQGRSLKLRVRILVLAADPAWREVHPQQRVRVTGRLTPPRGGDLTAAVLVTDSPPQPVGRPPWYQQAAAGLRSGLREVVAPLPAEPGGLVPGLAVGDVSLLDPGVEADFVATGMTHLVAVSGTHCAIVVGFVLVLARFARAPPWLAAVVSAAAMVGYAVLCQATPSVLRAAVMGGVALVALATGQRRATLPALAATVAVLVVVDPQLAASPGFVLSVTATAGLLLLAPGWRDALRRRGVPAGLAEALAVPAAAQLAVSPIIAAMTGTISLVSVAANLVATPVVVPATLLGVGATLVAPVWSDAGAFLAWLAHWPAWWLVLVARHGAGAPAAVVPWPDGWSGGLLLAALTVAGLWALRRPRWRRPVAVVAAAAAVGALPVVMFASGWPPAHAVAVACAVGQGDLITLPVRPGTAVVVDAGPEPVAADRCLRDLRVSAVPLLVISHYHLDHVGGISGVLRGRTVTAVLAPSYPEPRVGHDLLADAAAASRIPVVPARAGTVYRVGDVVLHVLAPLAEPMHGTRSDPNNNSVVLLAEVRGVRVLLAGDAETELQRALLARYGPAALRADVLKAAHHGSRYQDDAFLAAVSPAVALVPVGEANSYGHPHPELLETLARLGTRVLRTDTDGDVAAVLHDGALAVLTHAPPPVGRGPPGGPRPRDTGVLCLVSPG